SLAAVLPHTVPCAPSVPEHSRPSRGHRPSRGSSGYFPSSLPQISSLRPRRRSRYREDVSDHRPSLDPAVAEIRRAVRPALDGHRTVLVALSGGADSLALAAAVAFEAERAGVRAIAVTIDHDLQPGSAQVAADAAEAARALGLEAVGVAVEVGTEGGPEAAARQARYDALRDAATDYTATAVLLGHTLDDQAETVLLRVRERVLPVLESELGPGIADALARTAEQLREDAEAFAEMIDETIEDIVEPAEAGIAVSVAALAANPAALRNRIIRHVAASEFHVSLSRVQTLEVARLVTDWRGQGPIDLPGCRAHRDGGRIVLTAR
ncbi:MAG: putative ATPase of the PP-loop superfamily, partial [Microbacterium sp.]|nr:putative ATPase of the PP-loop superfamily [Microbacterium sp.]